MRSALADNEGGDRFSKSRGLKLKINQVNAHNHSIKNKHRSALKASSNLRAKSNPYDNNGPQTNSPNGNVFNFEELGNGSPHKSSHLTPTPGKQDHFNFLNVAQEQEFGESDSEQNDRKKGKKMSRR